MHALRAPGRPGASVVDPNKSAAHAVEKLLVRQRRMRLETVAPLPFQRARHRPCSSPRSQPNARRQRGGSPSQHRSAPQPPPFLLRQGAPSNHCTTAKPQVVQPSRSTPTDFPCCPCRAWHSMASTPKSLAPTPRRSTPNVDSESQTWQHLTRAGASSLLRRRSPDPGALEALGLEASGLLAGCSPHGQWLDFQAA